MDENMSKQCLDCNVAMKLLNPEGIQLCEVPYKEGDVFSNRTGKHGIGAQYWFCPKCGKVKMYLTDKSLNYLNKNLL